MEGDGIKEKSKGDKMTPLSNKIRTRVRRAVRSYEHEPRVYFYRGEYLSTVVPVVIDHVSLEEGTVLKPRLPLWGIYKAVHVVKEIPFRVDRRGRIYLYEG